MTSDDVTNTRNKKQKTIQTKIKIMQTAPHIDWWCLGEGTNGVDVIVEN